MWTGGILMKLTTIVTSIAFAATMAVAGLGTQSASASFVPAPSGWTAPSCRVTTTGKDAFAINNGNVTATFTVEGDNCKVDVTLVTWQAPNATDGKPYDQQKLFSYTTGTFKPGTRTLTTKLPNCFYQVDLVTGSKPTDANGGPRYIQENRLRRSLHGGSQSCDTTVVTPPTTPTASVTPQEELADTGASTNAIIATVVSTVVASSVAFRSFLIRKNA